MGRSAVARLGPPRPPRGALKQQTAATALAALAEAAAAESSRSRSSSRSGSGSGNTAGKGLEAALCMSPPAWRAAAHHATTTPGPPPPPLALHRMNAPLLPLVPRAPPGPTCQQSQRDATHAPAGHDQRQQRRSTAARVACGGTPHKIRYGAAARHLHSPETPWRCKAKQGDASLHALQCYRHQRLHQGNRKGRFGSRSSTCPCVGLGWELRQGIAGVHASQHGTYRMPPCSKAGGPDTRWTPARPRIATAPPSQARCLPHPSSQTPHRLTTPRLQHLEQLACRQAQGRAAACRHLQRTDACMQAGRKRGGRPNA